MFKRNKKNEKEPLTPWGEPIIEEEKTEDKTSFKTYVSGGLRSFRQKLSGFTPQSKIRIKYLLKAKRGLAGILFMLNILTFAVSIPDISSIIFFLTSFILLDYLWKTRRVEWISDKVSS